MATLEHDALHGQRARPHERHVFASHDGRRQRFLRVAGIVAGALALAWLAALALALVGDSSLPVLPAPAAMRDAPARAASAPPRHSHAIRRAASTPRPLQAGPARVHPASAARAARTAAPAPPTPAAPVTPAAPAQTAVTPQRGWARRGRTAPPGQAKRNDPIPRGRSHSTHATAATTHGNGHGRG